MPPALVMDNWRMPPTRQGFVKALQNSGVWEGLQPKIVYANTIS